MIGLYDLVWNKFPGVEKLQEEVQSVISNPGLSSAVHSVDIYIGKGVARYVCTKEFLNEFLETEENIK